MQIISALSLTVLCTFVFSEAQASPVDVKSSTFIVRGGTAQPPTGYLPIHPRGGDSKFDFKLVDPITAKTVTHNRRGEQCDNWYQVSQDDTCQTVADKHGIHLNDFLLWNPVVNKDCTNLNVGKSYCVSVGWPNADESCSKQHTVISGDTCTKIAVEYGISRSELLALNPRINSDCKNLITGDSYCVARSSRSEFPMNEKIKQEEHKDIQVSKKAKEQITNLIAKPSHQKRKLIHSNIPMTYYWIAQPEDYPQSGKSVAIKTCSGKTLGYAPQSYADALVMEGTGVLGNKVVNLGACSCRNYNCFLEVDRAKNPYGLTSYSTSLRPFITAAANDIPRGTKVYVPELDGWKIPGTGKMHNGCLVVEDKGWSFSSRHLDFFVYSMANYRTLNQKHGVSKISVYEDDGCDILDYM